MILDILFLGSTLKQWLFFTLYLIIGVFLSRLFLVLAKSFFSKLALKTKNKIDDIIVDIMQKPFPFVLFIIILFLDFGIDQLTISLYIQNILKNIFFVLYILCISWFMAKFLLSVIDVYLSKKPGRSNNKLNSQLVPILKNLSKVLVIIFAVLVVLSNFGYNIGALLAGLGIGGLAVALAAKPALENLISGVVLFGEKNFNIGDIVKLNGEYGTIMEIGLRSTKVQKFDGTLLIIPNSNVVSNTVENISFRKTRREELKLGLTYGTSVAKLKEAKKIIKNILTKNKNVAADFYIRFEEFADFSLDIKVTYYITELDWGKYLNIKDKININIKSEFEKANIDFAFPTQTIELKK